MFRKDCIHPDLLIEGPQDLKKVPATSDVSTTSPGEFSEIQGLMAALRATVRPAVIENSHARRYVPDLADK